MKIFGGLKAQEPSFDTQRAVMTIIVAAIKSDGDVSEDEVNRLRSICVRSPIFSSNSKEEDDRVISFADNVTGQLGNSAIDKAANTLQQDLRETAFLFACEMVLSDGMVAPDEERFISDLAQKLNISEEIGNAIVTTTLIRMRS